MHAERDWLRNHVFPELAGATAGAFPPRADRLDTLKQRLLTELPERTRRYRAEWDPEHTTVTGLRAFGESVDTASVIAGLDLPSLDRPRPRTGISAALRYPLPSAVLQ